MSSAISLVTLIGSTQAEVLRALWEMGPSGAAEVHRYLQDLRARNKQKPVAFTTVTTILHRMTEKGLLTKDEESRRYKAVSRQTIEDRMLSELSDVLDV